ncbi:carbohydrate porin [Endozoicomonas sp. ONNA2]|uniref:carbohydrate porin n=1 Tax=Endozoicomonas sp. ONNA2 TaxID=2828741 RepID=UPI0021484B4A|nr:carbohydrate porin [Endozoicomonas sp. ONNA2]
MTRSLLATALLLASSISYGEWTSPDGSLTIGGDAEINFDVVKNHRGADSKGEKFGPDVTTTQTQLNDDSRIKMMVQWQTARTDNDFLAAKIEPLIRTDGTVQVDDSYFMFGTKKTWEFQIGCYEAMNLFPLGKDVVLDYANGSDGLGAGIYYYMAKEARGRAGPAGQARLSGQVNHWTAEISTIYGNTENVLESTQSYIDSDNLGNMPELKSDNNSFMIRPAINYMSDTGGFSLSFGGEFEVNKDSVTVVATDTLLNLSDRYGLAITAGR